ncbi:TPA: hypothetical protein HA361_07050 [Candidatus Woesearchaeota archaeon]|nr:hypothetical protein [Candidatus Woesearchaeota archaeon]HII68592.1 hypothetical protein [Candidatus Woesearchaeota archaeon]
MLKKLLWKLIEFLAGFFILPRLIALFLMALIPFLGLDAQASLLLKLGLSAIALVALFFFRKIVALGFLCAIIWEYAAGYLSLFGE